MAPSWVFEAAVSAAGRRRHLERNAERTKANILAAAVAEFSDKGFAGARVDSIAEMAGCNKGMIYQYYGSKEHLYDEVIAYEYQTLSNIEAEIIQNHTDLRELIDVIVDRYFDFLLRHPDFVKIIMWENLNEARSVRANPSLEHVKAPIIECIREAVRRGRREGIFNENANSKVVVFALITGAFSYFSNCHTLPVVLRIDLNNPEFLLSCKQIVKAGIRSYLKK